MTAGFWDNAETISSYSRADALGDGTLIDISATAREAGFIYPTAMTAAAWFDAVAWDDENDGLQDEKGRLWDVLTMAALATRRGGSAEARIFEVVRIPNTPRATRPQLTKLKLLIGPGDTADSVLTITCLDED